MNNQQLKNLFGDYTDAYLLQMIQDNIDTQKRNAFKSLASVDARGANQQLFAEANRRGLKGEVR